MSDTNQSHGAKQLLQRLHSQTTSPELRAKALGLLKIAEAGEVEPEQFSSVTESVLRKYAGTDPAVDAYLLTQDAIGELEHNFGGIRKVLETAQKTELYSQDERFQYLVDRAKSQIEAGIPSYRVAENFVPGIRSYAWNSVMRGPLAQMQKRLDDTAQLRNVYAAATDLRGDGLWNGVSGRLFESLGIPAGSLRDAHLTQTLRSAVAIGPAPAALTPIAESVNMGAGQLAQIRGDYRGRLRVTNRMAPALVTESSTVILLGNRLLEIPKTGKSSARLLESKEVRNLPVDFLKTCEAFTQVKVNGRRLMAHDGVYEYALNIPDTAAGVCTLEIDGVCQDGTVEQALQNQVGMSPQVDVLINLLNLANQAASMIVQLDQVATCTPATATAMADCPTPDVPVFDLFQNGEQSYLSMWDPQMQTQELFEGRDAIKRVGESYGLQLLPVLEGNDGSDEDVKLIEDAAKRQEEAQKLADKRDKLQEDLEEIMSNLEKIEMLDEDYRNDKDVKRLYSELRERREQVEQDLGRIKSKMLAGDSSESASEVDPEGIASAVLSKILDLVRDPDVRQEFRQGRSEDVVRRPGDPILLGAGLGCVIPIVEFESADDDQYRISEVLLQYHDGAGSGPDEAEAALAKLIGDNDTYKPIEGGYLALDIKSNKVDSADQIQIPEELEGKLVDALSVMSKGNSGELLQDGEQEQEEEEEEEGTGSTGLSTLAKFCKDSDPDYGTLFKKKDDDERLYLVMGDSAEYFEEAKAMAKEAGFELEGEAEAYPTPEEDWEEVSA